MTDFVIDKDKLEVTTSRTFKASAQRLFQAHTNATDIPQWWAPNDYTVIVDKLDVRVGGAWRFIHTAPDGNKYAFNGIFKEIDEPSKLVSTFEYEGQPGHVLIQTTTFAEQGDGTTKLTKVAHYDNVEDLQGMVDMDMEVGERQGMDRLATLVEST